MDLATVAAQFDDERAKAAIAELAEACQENAPVQPNRINRAIAKTAREWAKIMQRSETSVYNLLVDRIEAGTWERIVAREDGMHGKGRYFYHPAGCDPFLPDSTEEPNDECNEGNNQPK